MIYNKIIFIGSQGTVGKEFVRLVGTSCEITGIDKGSPEFSLKDTSDNYDWLIWSVHSSESKAQMLTRGLFNDHVNLLRQILEEAVGKVRKIILFSTGSVYTPSEAPLAVGSPLNYKTTNPYVLSKIISELLVTSFSAYFEGIIILRPFYIYGPGQKTSMLLSGLIEKVRNSIPIGIRNDGGMIFNPVYVKDVAEILKKIIESEQHEKISFHNIAGKDIISLMNVIGMISSILNIPAIVRSDGGDCIYSVGVPSLEPEQNTTLQSGLVETISNT